MREKNVKGEMKDHGGKKAEKQRWKMKGLREIEVADLAKGENKNA